MPESLIESELFGYAPGTFTGARSKGMRGLIQQAEAQSSRFRSFSGASSPDRRRGERSAGMGRPTLTQRRSARKAERSPLRSRPMRALVLVSALVATACSGSRQPSSRSEPPAVATVELPDASSASAEPEPTAEDSEPDASAGEQPDDAGERLVTLGTVGDSGARVLGVLSADASGLSALLGAQAGAGLGSAPAPSPAQAGAPSVVGDYPKEIVRRYVRRQLSRIRACYERVLAQHPALETKLVVEFVIGKDGNVRSAKAATPSNDPSLDACVLAVIARIQFPTPKSGTIVVRYPFVFRAAP